ncbi:hypothetical protein D3C75_879550 [compost metagenome]
MTRVIVGWVAGVWVILDNDEAENAPDVKLTEAWFDNMAGTGIEMITSNVTVAEALGATVPIGMPVAGLADGTGAPLTVTLPGTKVEPDGITSLSTALLMGERPLLVTTVV